MLALALASLAVSQVIDLGPKETVLLVRMSPRTLANPPSSERIFRVASSAIGEGSALELLSPEQAGVDEARLAECELDRRLSCWAKEVGRAADHLLVLSMLEASDGTEVTSFLLDVRAARDKSENEIFEITRVLRSVIDLERDEALSSHLAELLAPIAARAPTGSIAIRSTASDLSIAIDGKSVGVTRPGTTTIVGVAPGSHDVLLEDPRTGPIFDRAIEVKADAIAQIDLSLPAPAPDTFRTITIWSGVGVALAGAAVTIAAIALAPDAEMTEPCVGSGCVAEREETFYRPGGVLLAPLGYSLIGAGGVAALGSALMPDGDLFVYLSIAAGIVVGAASYGISAAF